MTFILLSTFITQISTYCTNSFYGQANQWNCNILKVYLLRLRFWNRFKSKLRYLSKRQLSVDVVSSQLFIIETNFQIKLHEFCESWRWSNSVYYCSPKLKIVEVSEKQHDLAKRYVRTPVTKHRCFFESDQSGVSSK